MLSTKIFAANRFGVSRFILIFGILFVTRPTHAAPPEADVSSPNPRTTSLGAFAAAGYLGSPGTSGSALTAGLRLGIGTYFAVGFDLGYGVLSAHPAVQDRWWLIPSAALVIPTRWALCDLGGGAGLGASSGYTSWSQYIARPFEPIWAFQLMPTLRAHGVARVKMTRTLDLFARVDVASLLMLPSSHAGLKDSTWATLSLGVQFQLL